jgi:hypothetical protein
MHPPWVLPCRSVSMLSPGVVELALIVTVMFGAGLLEPRRFFRRLQLLSRMEHHEQDNEQVFP